MRLGSTVNVIRHRNLVLKFVGIRNAVAVLHALRIRFFVIEKSLRQEAASNAKHFQLEEDGGEQFQKIGFAAAVAAGADERGDALFSFEFFIEFPLRPKVVFESGVQAAEGFGIGKF